MKYVAKVEKYSTIQIAKRINRILRCHLLMYIKHITF